MGCTVYSVFLRLIVGTQQEVRYHPLIFLKLEDMELDLVIHSSDLRHFSVVETVVGPGDKMRKKIE